MLGRGGGGGLRGGGVATQKNNILLRKQPSARDVRVCMDVSIYTDNLTYDHNLGPEFQLLDKVVMLDFTTVFCRGNKQNIAVVKRIMQPLSVSASNLLPDGAGERPTEKWAGLLTEFTDP